MQTTHSYSLPKRDTFFHHIYLLFERNRQFLLCHFIPPLGKKKNGYTILNPANGIFGLRHYPCLPTAYDYINTAISIKQVQPSFLGVRFDWCTFLFLILHKKRFVSHGYEHAGIRQCVLCMSIPLRSCLSVSAHVTETF